MPSAASLAEGDDHPPSPVDRGIDLLLSVESDGWGQPDEREALAGRAVDSALRVAGLQLSDHCELSVVLTDDEAVQALNAKWRGKDRPTNVLSFPAFDLTPGDPLPGMLGDIVIARGVVAREAEEAGKTFDDHLTHLVVHGFLHLAGWDHMTDEEAGAMEALEKTVLARLGIADPYADTIDQATPRDRV